VRNTDTKHEPRELSLGFFYSRRPQHLPNLPPQIYILIHPYSSLALLAEFEMLAHGAVEQRLDDLDALLRR
jgi:hypothetical protein